MSNMDVSELLDNPTVLLQKLYDTTFTALPDAIAQLRNARLNKTDAELNYDEEYRKAQLIIQKQAQDKGEKLTIAERELKAKDAAMEAQTKAETADVVASAAADFVFLLKDQKDTLNTLVMWKMAEMKMAPTTIGGQNFNKQGPSEPDVPDMSQSGQGDDTPPDLQF